MKRPKVSKKRLRELAQITACREAAVMRKCRHHSDNEYFYEHVHSAIAFIGLRWND